MEPGIGGKTLRGRWAPKPRPRRKLGRGLGQELEKHVAPEQVAHEQEPRGRELLVHDPERVAEIPFQHGRARKMGTFHTDEKSMEEVFLSMMTTQTL